MGRTARDLDVGMEGRAIGRLDSETLNTDADGTSAAHGGESVGQLCMRVGQWLASLETQPGHVIAVTHPFVIRAAMLYITVACMPDVLRIDVEPLSSVELPVRPVYWLVAVNGVKYAYLPQGTDMCKMASLVGAIVTAHDTRLLVP